MRRGGYTAACVADIKTMGERELVRRRGKTVNRRAACRNSIHGITPGTLLDGFDIVLGIEPDISVRGITPGTLLDSTICVLRHRKGFNPETSALYRLSPSSDW